jgi:hypothetical protein
MAAMVVSAAAAHPGIQGAKLALSTNPTSFFFYFSLTFF